MARVTGSGRPRETSGDERRAYRHQAPPRQLPTRLRHGASSKTFAYLDAFCWRRVMRWLCRKHQHTGWRRIRRRWLPGWRPTEGNLTLFDPGTVAIKRYRYRGAAIPTPWAATTRSAG